MSESRELENWSTESVEGEGRDELALEGDQMESSISAPASLYDEASDGSGVSFEKEKEGSDIQTDGSMASNSGSILRRTNSTRGSNSGSVSRRRTNSTTESNSGSVLRRRTNSKKSTVKDGNGCTSLTPSQFFTCQRQLFVQTKKSTVAAFLMCSFLVQNTIVIVLSDS